MDKLPICKEDKAIKLALNKFLHWLEPIQTKNCYPLCLKKQLYFECVCCPKTNCYQKFWKTQRYKSKSWVKYSYHWYCRIFIQWQKQPWSWLIFHLSNQVYMNKFLFSVQNTLLLKSLFKTAKEQSQYQSTSKFF